MKIKGERKRRELLLVAVDDDGLAVKKHCGRSCRCAGISFEFLGAHRGSMVLLGGNKLRTNLKPFLENYS